MTGRPWFDEQSLETSHDPSRAWLEVTRLRHPALAGTRATMLELLIEHSDALERSCRPGHFTGSALVMHPDRRRVLLLFHTKLQRWLQPGGHADGEANLAHVALREATEETGIAGLRVQTPAVDIDIHEVSHDGDTHLHYDVRYLVMAPVGAQPAGNHESEDLRWVEFGDLDDYGLDEGTYRMIEAGRHRLEPDGPGWAQTAG
ncbi:MAG: NUDIX hydrolase [Acidimicrobiales bacterium]